MAAIPDKDTIYIDIDDEITGVIDKLHTSSSKVVAFVLPKRASVFQSIVNMKLLKRAADDAKKHLVLITSEAGLLPLAGAAGVHVAKTLTSKPEIPLAPQAISEDEETIGEDDGEPELTAETAGERPVGELAGAAAAAPLAADGMETLELDDDELPEEAAAPLAVAAGKPMPKKDKKLSVPNFERFRLLLIAGGVILVLLIIGLIFALTVLPKATIAITTDATNVPTNLDLNLSTTASSLRGSTIPAKLAQQQKTFSQQVATTGQKNLGSKATGQVTITNCSPDNSDIEIPAGTGVSAGGQTYITQSAASLPFSGHRNNGSCQSAGGITSATVGITAQGPGTQYNTGSGTSFSVTGYGNVNAKASGSISGGTDNNVQVVTQGDINNAKNKVNATDDTIKQALQSQLKGDGYYALTATYSTGTPATTTSANAGDVANNVTVTEAVTYTMFGVHESDLKSVVDKAIKSKIDTSKQSILDDGIGKANYNVSSNSATGGQVTFTTNATAGPELNTDTIKQQAAGKKSGDIRSQLKSNPDVTDVNVKLSPFWVTSVPKKASKITVTIAKPVNTTGKSNGSNP